MLKIENVGMKFGKETVLEQINFEMEHGVYALLAPNGFGKTTLMKILSTIERPTSGKVSWNQKDIFEWKEKYRDILGYLPQKVGYYQQYSGVENLQYIAAIKGIPKKRADKRIEMLLEKFNLYDARNKKAKTYSGGMIQRLGIAGALLNEPEILLLDEPSAGLDPKERNHLKKVLAHLGKNCIILISTHITSDIEFLANEIVMLKDKTILFYGTAEEIRKSLEGNVYETVISQEAYGDFIQEHMIFDEQVSQEGIKVRFYGGENTVPGWKRTEANLNDIFLYQYGVGSE
ncbi:MAG: ATP-binding cassette domain-containing protein [Muribaculaceae bacterium]|nr:ATP-binding cassette domain-containing protein [Muribaculaceae bacterium]